MSFNNNTSSNVNIRKTTSAQSLLALEEEEPVNVTPDSRKKVTAAEVQMAYSRIRPYIHKTPLVHTSSLVPNFKLWCKHEQAHHGVGSYKCRGALNALMLLTEEEKQHPVVTASAGNFSTALSFMAKKLNLRCTVVMPSISPLAKRALCDTYGAEVIIQGSNLNESREIAMKYAADNGFRYINGYNDIEIICGAASVGIEIFEQLPDLECIVVPLGGGGLIAGIAYAAKQRNPMVRIIGVQSESCPSWAGARANGGPCMTSLQPTIADGTHVSVVGSNSFAVADKLIDEIVLVEEQYIALAIVRALENEKLVLEGSGALGVAAMLAGKLDHIKKLKTVTIFTGGNVDITQLARIISRGLYVDQRLLRIRVQLSDSPGALANYLAMISEIGCSVKDIVQERSYIVSNCVWIRTTVETRGKEHSMEMLSRLRKEGYEVFVETDNPSGNHYKRPPSPKRHHLRSGSNTPALTPLVNWPSAQNSNLSTDSSNYLKTTNGNNNNNQKNNNDDDGDNTTKTDISISSASPPTTEGLPTSKPSFADALENSGRDLDEKQTKVLEGKIVHDEEQVQQSASPPRIISTPRETNKD